MRIAIKEVEILQDKLKIAEQKIKEIEKTVSNNIKLKIKYNKSDSDFRIRATTKNFLITAINELAEVTNNIIDSEQIANTKINYLNQINMNSLLCELTLKAVIEKIAEIKATKTE